MSLLANVYDPWVYPLAEAQKTPMSPSACGLGGPIVATDLRDWDHGRQSRIQITL